jgi:hypothetical protein
MVEEMAHKTPRVYSFSKLLEALKDAWRSAHIRREIGFSPIQMNGRRVGSLKGRDKIV